MGNYDETYYASKLHGISSLVSILGTGRPPILPDHSGERYGRHATFSGTGGYPVSGSIEPDTVVDSVYIVDNLVNATPAFDVHRRTGTRYGAFSCNGSPETWAPYNQTDTSYSDIINSWFSQGLMVHGAGTQFWRWTGRIIDFFSSKDELSFRVESSCYFGGPYWGSPEVTCTWKYKVKFDLSSIFSNYSIYSNGSSGWWVWPPRRHVVFTSYTVSLSTWNQTFPDIPPEKQVSYLCFRGPLADLPRYEEDVVIGDQKYWFSLRNFRRAIDSSWSHITPSALFSVVAAVQDVEHGTSTDVLQTVTKLPQYKSMIPQITEALRLLKAIAKRDVDLMTIKEIVDLASATILQSSFQWRPLLQLLTSELPKIVASLSALRSRGQLVVGRGRYDFDFAPNTFARSESHLTTRSKIVLDVSARALASSLLGFDAFGILPKPSNLWDLVPFSFVANWFTGIGPSIRRAEYSAFLATIPAYYVHTYLITSPFTSEELDDWSIANDPLDPLSLKVFYRDVSSYTPLPQDSKFGFGIPTNLPPIGSVGALLWQVLT
jgi:hypothetical protein